MRSRPILAQPRPHATRSSSHGNPWCWPLSVLPGLVVHPVIAAGEVGLMAMAGVVLSGKQRTVPRSACVGLGAVQSPFSRIYNGQMAGRDCGCVSKNPSLSGLYLV